MILGMGAPELLVILLVTLVIFGPKNLPKLGSALGQTVKSVREGMEESDAAAAEKVKSEVSEASTEAQTAPSQKKKRTLSSADASPNISTTIWLR